MSRATIGVLGLASRYSCALPVKGIISYSCFSKKIQVGLAVTEDGSLVQRPTVHAHFTISALARLICVIANYCLSTIVWFPVIEVNDVFAVVV